jgi:anti-anti-sigma factor
MESIDTRNEKYAIIFNVNLVRATLNEASEFREVLDDAIKTSDKDIIVNLSDCQHLDSTFLGLLVSSYKKLKGQQRNLAIIEPVDQSSVFLTLNSIGKIFPIYRDIKAALTDIENKRILEYEINRLDEEIDLEPETLETEQIAQTELIDANDEELQEPVNLQETAQLEESIQEDLIMDNSEELDIPQENPEEHFEDLGITNDKMNDNTEELVNEENEMQFEEEAMENDSQEEIKFKKEIELEDGDFRKGSVKWEFGFSS